jgi:hypothetical protein
MENQIDITGLDKAEVLAALYNKAKVQGMGIFQAVNGDLKIEDARKILEESYDKYFDYLMGRVMKISLKSDLLSTWLYNRDNGDKAAERIIEGLKSKQTV